MKRLILPFITVCLAASLFATTGAGTSGAASTTSSRNGSFPVSVTNGAGVTTIASRPTRILSLSASATEMLYAIGAMKQVVGVDKYSWYPANAPRTKFTGDETSAESYLPYRPDLVILAFDENNLVAQLKKLHVPVLLLETATTVAEANQQLTELGEATGHESAAAAAITSVNDYLNKAVQQVGDEARGKSYYVELDPTLYSATAQTFIGALFARFGMVNIANAAAKDGDQYPQLSSEYLLKRNPDYVFLADIVCCNQSAKTFAARPGFSVLGAVKDHHVFGVNDSWASEWGPRSLELFVSAIAEDVTGKSS